MHNAPFRFLDSPAAVQGLGKALAQIGLTAEKPPPDLDEKGRNKSLPIRMYFSCRWLDSPVEIQWRYAWWPDGTHQELAHVVVIFEEEPLADIDVAGLLSRSQPKPLAEEIISRIVTRCAQLTGTRPPKRGKRNARPAGKSKSSSPDAVLPE